MQSVITSMGRNSTLQPISEFGGGGLNLIVCQLVDCRFCKKTSVNKYKASSCLYAWMALFYEKLRGYRRPHLKVIRLVFIIQVNFLLKHGEWISDEEVSYVLGQQPVNSYTRKADYSLLHKHPLMEFDEYLSFISHISSKLVF